MAQFLRHIGKHGDRKVAIVFREVPGEPHMALVVYTELLNDNMHNPLMACIESDIGQHSDSLSEALNRSYCKDGTVILQRLHNEGMLKKVNTENIVVTPAPNANIKLKELNEILDKMDQGEEAVNQLKEMDDQLGMTGTAYRKKAADMAENLQELAAGSDTALTDDAIANNLKAQAERMANDAKNLIAESERMMAEAAEMLGETAPVAEPVAEPPKKRGRGRPRKNAA